jgi:hypothetical protein
MAGESGHSLTGSSDASLLATLQNVLLQIGCALAVLAIPLELELPDASDEVLGRHVVQVGSIRGHGGGGTEREQTDEAGVNRTHGKKQGGGSRVRVVGQLRSGRTAKQASHFWVSGRGECTWIGAGKGFFDGVSFTAGGAGASGTRKRGPRLRLTRLGSGLSPGLPAFLGNQQPQPPSAAGCSPGKGL